MYDCVVFIRMRRKVKIPVILFFISALLFGGCVSERAAEKAWDSEAAKWLKNAAEEGNVYAQNCYAECCFYGDGVPQNKDEAVKYLRLAAEAGNSDAEEFLKQISSGKTDYEDR